jgi:hypothetical protein
MAAEAEQLLATTSSLISRQQRAASDRAGRGMSTEAETRTTAVASRFAEPAEAHATGNGNGNGNGNGSTPAALRPVAAERASTPEEIERKIERIYGVQQTAEGMLFRARGDGIREVQLAGDFNGWLPHTATMRRVGDDFELLLPLAPGRYRYRVVVDGRWSHDMANPIREPNQYGEFNSVVEVPGA